MRYQLMAIYQGLAFEAGLGPTDEDVVLFSAGPPPGGLQFEPVAGQWRRQLGRSELDALWESRPVGRYRGQGCLVLDDLGDRLHIAFQGHDAYQAEQLGYWQVDRGVYEVVVPRHDVTDLTEVRNDHPTRRAEQALPSGPPRPATAHAGPGTTPAGLASTPPGPVPAELFGRGSALTGSMPAPAPVTTAPGPVPPGQPDDSREETPAPATAAAEMAMPGPVALLPAPPSGPRSDPVVAPAAHDPSNDAAAWQYPTAQQPARQQASSQQPSPEEPGAQQPGQQQQEPPEAAAQELTGRGPAAQQQMPDPLMPHPAGPERESSGPQWTWTVTADAPSTSVEAAAKAPEAASTGAAPPEAASTGAAPPEAASTGAASTGAASTGAATPQPAGTQAAPGAPQQPPAPEGGDTSSDTARARPGPSRRSGAPLPADMMAPAPPREPPANGAGGWHPRSPGTDQGRPRESGRSSAKPNGPNGSNGWNGSVSGSSAGPPGAADRPAGTPAGTASGQAAGIASGTPAGGASGQAAGAAGGQAGGATPGTGTRARRGRTDAHSIFKDLVALAAIPEGSYAVDADVDGARCLVRTDDGFEVYSSAGSAKHDVRFFEDQESAYYYLFGVLAADAVRTGRLVRRH